MDNPYKMLKEAFLYAAIVPHGAQKVKAKNDEHFSSLLFLFFAK